MSRKREPKLWGGRFQKTASPIVERFTHSLGVDQRLARYDLLGSIAHAAMLGKRGIIPAQEARRIVRTLQSILKAVEKGRVVWPQGAEDIHTAIQGLLTKRLGAVADHLHAGRSRNDQVVTSFRLYLKDQCRHLESTILRLQQTILREAQLRQGLTLPGMTHLRQAQPILLSHLLVSYLHPLHRDRQRLKDACRRLDELPLGSGALAGTGLPIDRSFLAKRLRFSRVGENSIDGITDRDFVVELLAALALLGVHLSRMAEDLILFSTESFGFLRFDEGLLTGSSMMPQKQNPDFLELIRAHAARLSGSLTSSLTLLKGLPTGYQRDLQLDKEILFGAIDRTEGMLEVLRTGFKGLRWNPKRMLAAFSDGSVYATDLAEYLVMNRVPFAQAHRVVGRLLAWAQARRKSLPQLPLTDFRRFSPAFQEDLYTLFNPETSVGRKRSFGSTHPRLVAQSIQRWRKLLAKG